MHCAEFERILFLRETDRTWDDAGRLRRHAAACAACREKTREAAWLDLAVRCWNDAVPEVDLVDRILGGLVSTRAASNQNHSAVTRSRTRISLGAGTKARHASAGVLTASAAAMLLLLLGAREERRGVEPAQVVRREPSSPETTPADVRPDDDLPSADLDLLVRDAGLAYLSLARGTVDAFAEAKIVMQLGLRETDESRNGNGSPIPSNPWWGQWRDEMTPLGQELEQTLDLLRDALPVNFEPAT